MHSHMNVKSEWAVHGATALPMEAPTLSSSTPRLEAG